MQGAGLPIPNASTTPKPEIGGGGGVAYSPAAKADPAADFMRSSSSTGHNNHPGSVVEEDSHTGRSYGFGGGALRSKTGSWLFDEEPAQLEVGC